MTQTQKIERALAKGLSVSTIAARYDVHPSRVYAIRKARLGTITPAAPVAPVAPAPSSGIVSLTLPSEPQTVFRFPSVPPGAVVEVPEPDKPLSMWKRFWMWLAGVRK